MPTKVNHCYCSLGTLLTTMGYYSPSWTAHHNLQVTSHCCIGSEASKDDQQTEKRLDEQILNPKEANTAAPHTLIPA